jgi:phage tail sheath protein FI
MASYLGPGVYVEDMPSGARPIGAIGTSVAAILGTASQPGERVGQPLSITSFTEFGRKFAAQQTGTRATGKPVAN